MVSASIGTIPCSGRTPGSWSAWSRQLGGDQGVEFKSVAVGLARASRLEWGNCPQALRGACGRANCRLEPLYGRFEV